MTQCLGMVILEMCFKSVPECTKMVNKEDDINISFHISSLKTESCSENGWLLYGEILAKSLE